MLTSLALAIAVEVCDIAVLPSEVILA